MNILFSVTYYTPYVSGLTIYVKRLAEELVKRDHKVAALCMRHDKSLPEIEDFNGVEVARAKPLLKLSKGFLSIDWIAKSWRETRGADVVIINLPQAEGWITALMAKKVIVVYHCEIVLQNKILQKVLEFMNWISLLKASIIVTYTEDYAKNSRLLRGFENKTKYIYPPIPYPTTGKLKLNKPKGEIWIGVAARLAQEKGIEYLLGALPLLKNCKIIIAGPENPVGEEKYKEKIMKLVEKYENRIRFLGTIDPEDMGGFYKMLDVLALSSVNSTEAFGMVQVEAMMCGVPVVASDLPGVRVPILKTGMGKLAKPSDSKSLAEAIEWAVDNRDRLREKRILAIKEFNVKEIMKKWERLLE
ncbi:hypothetical protein A3D85_03115 [Candidatus Amesbacteria bacterium RIFCSPHIGHO2_02_FULL_47_9]|uniref:Glycosyl transferase family 1 domain-containing protein n=1 Tax=Candidatus Amesbacteria bacterium RIFCSPHIGHO2_01_FULL_48_32b TaxID=1797253 RepID=A0A1F4YGD0_9BACT|nr:MAG: hypothetical protein A2876_00740 [Candidatus Amesbacteria bacterium RIFCSPHIGHO2_01_FULL_48_32b]OGD02251.1 MAG: hypothetical protein A3D85_03115 [Candidatus Amesbacteria bacterium RIFCSPHIGHO2_02_FULL_47_9]OGD07456.1 MAG: hypothetical protein A2899_04095 [Candidatus Amesbacteria bacterium RIFCSPLOWO2_01_FULL_49_25]